MNLEKQLLELLSFINTEQMSLIATLREQVQSQHVTQQQIMNDHQVLLTMLQHLNTHTSDSNVSAENSIHQMSVSLEQLQEQVQTLSGSVESTQRSVRLLLEVLES
ncbi:hypothetical protein [Aeromonas salmonicida]|uniref:hypothetical protein n=1 Tax=Aeromonas salmonicida TaxID=645 RepID=UPI002116025E|nr:hypothetical protein [Aeromonas salmonicida]UUI59118.1 hypothetical protein NP805_13005 [Aeromonas salmonicida]